LFKVAKWLKTLSEMEAADDITDAQVTPLPRRLFAFRKKFF
jgi:hypothetical protein